MLCIPKELIGAAFILWNAASQSSPCLFVPLLSVLSLNFEYCQTSRHLYIVRVIVVKAKEYLIFMTFFFLNRGYFSKHCMLALRQFSFRDKRVGLFALTCDLVLLKYSEDPSRVLHVLLEHFVHRHVGMQHLLMIVCTNGSAQSFPQDVPS